MVSTKCTQKCLKRARIAKKNALRIAAVMGTAPDQIFSFDQDMTPLNPYMFPSSTTGEMYYPDTVVKLHEKILKDAGLEHIRFLMYCLLTEIVLFWMSRSSQRRATSSPFRKPLTSSR